VFSSLIHLYSLVIDSCNCIDRDKHCAVSDAQDSTSGDLQKTYTPFFRIYQKTMDFSSIFSIPNCYSPSADILRWIGQWQF